MRYSLLFILIILTGIGCKSHQNRTAEKAAPKTPAAINLCGPTVADLNTEPGHDGRLSPLYAGLEVYHYPITTKSEMAQRYFDQGMVLSFGFNHAEASRSFREAIRQDPECVACYWGLAYVLGPNYNAPMDFDVLSAANEALMSARLHLSNASPKEQGLVKALMKRYPASKDIAPFPYYEAYADAMRQLSSQFPADVDIQIMTAEALMDLHPWDLWEKSGSARPWTPEIVQLLEKALATHPDHPQAMHLYIHTMEASKEPERALKAADDLRYAVPGSGHLVHMPSHLYINVGKYHEGAIANELAVKIDSAYVESCHAAGIYPLAYYPHNWHFLAACAALEGRGKRALEASRYMADFVVDKTAMLEPGMGAIQHYYTIPWYIMVKFAMWEEIVNEPAPDAQVKYPYAIWQYAQGMAHSARQDFAAAEASLNLLKELAQDSSLLEVTVWDINSVFDLVKIAAYVLEGSIAQQRGEWDLAIQQLEKATIIEDQLNYNEPPDWFFSVRHLLGDVLLKAGRYAEAEAVYLEDLEKLRENGWALMGLYQSQIGQHKIEASHETKKRFDVAWKWADKDLQSSVL